MQGSGVTITFYGREKTAMTARGACDHWQGNMLQPEIDGRLVAAGSSPVKAHYSLKCCDDENMPRRVNRYEIFNYLEK